MPLFSFGGREMDEIIKKIYDSILNFVDDLDENKARLAIRIQVRKCLNYMNRNDFPEELIEPLAEAMALEYLEENDREVKSVSVGDTKEEYVTGTANTDKIALTMRGQLNRFRRIGTVGTSKEM